MMLVILAAWTVATQAPDSVAHARLRDAMLALTDSLNALAGASAAFTRDLDRSSRQSVLTRGGEVRARCTSARAAVDDVHRVYTAHAAVVAQDRGMPEYRRELGQLGAELARCEREWQTPYAAAAADSLRSWGPHRLTLLDAAMRRYTAAEIGRAHV